MTGAIKACRSFSALWRSCATWRLVCSVVTSEDPSSVRPLIGEKSLSDRVAILPPRQDIEFYYAAADAYAGPSLQDSYGMPPAEAMACGLPVIVSAAAGVSEIITNAEDGVILDDPTDSAKLAAIVRLLYQDRELCNRLGTKAAQTALKYTWGGNGRELALIFSQIVQRRADTAMQTLTPE